MKRAFLLLILFVLVLPTSLHARTWLARQDGSGDCTTIMGCVNLAGNGDTVLVGPGVYTESIRVVNKTDFVLRAEGDVTQTIVRGGLPCAWFENVLGQSSVEGFTFDGCISPTGVGAMLLEWSSITVRRNLFVNCAGFAGPEGGPGVGGAMEVGECSGRITENTIYHCDVEIDGIGGGIHIAYSPDMPIDHNIIVNCVGGGIYGEGSIPVISCNDVWANSPSNYEGSIPDQTGLNGNISMDPLFCDPSLENFLLRCDSPCLNAVGCGRIGALGVGCGSTSVTPTTWGKIKTLFR